MVKCGVIVDHFPLHGKGKESINSTWNKHGFKLTLGFLFGTWEKDMQPLNAIADYYGEKWAFYFAWLIHYISWLIIPSVAGLALLGLQLYNYWGLKKPFYDAFDDKFNVVYSFLIMLWATLLVESWKRKESYIANKWLMRDYQEHAELRKEYKFILDVDSETRSEWKISMTNRFLRLMLVGIPISFIFIALVVAAQVGMRYWYLSIITDPKEEPSFIYRLTPFLCYAFLLIIFGRI